RLRPVWVYLATSEIPSVYGFIGWGGIMGGILLDALMRRGLKGSRKNREPGAEQTLDGAAGGELSPVSGGKSC
ncbi:MAG: hypothetical protein OEZ59_02955, partial [Deltaproteobacteria bacterium]|nr:hypothetical protein [Deltaproteobacteria bacterium]